MAAKGCDVINSKATSSQWRQAAENCKVSPEGANPQRVSTEIIIEIKQLSWSNGTPLGYSQFILQSIRTAG